MDKKEDKLVFPLCENGCDECADIMADGSCDLERDNGKPYAPSTYAKWEGLRNRVNKQLEDERHSSRR